MHKMKTNPMRILKILLFVLAANVFAASSPKFDIEQIEVQGVGSRLQSIVVAQSLLHSGETYSERELADANSRIRRLPFVRDVDISLKKGTTRGRFQLVIVIAPMMPVFYDALSATNSAENQTPRVRTVGSLTVGGRLPVGATGVVRASVTANDDLETILGNEGTRRRPLLNLGYTLYRIGSRSVFADVSFDYQDADAHFADLRFGDFFAGNLVVGVPLRSSQSLRAEWNRVYIPARQQDGESTPIQFDLGQLFWLRDSTDDPLYPLRGSLLKGGVFAGTQHQIDQAVDYYGGELAASYYLEIAPERSLSFHGRYERQHFDSRTFPIGGNVSILTIAAGLTQRLPGPTTDAWISFRAEGTRFNRAPETDALRAHVEVAHRSKWGVARARFEYFGQRQ